MSFKCKNLTKGNSPLSELFFVKIKNKILGKNYELSLVLIGNTRAKKLNQNYRKKNYIPNTLSFPIDSNVGEIFLNPKQIEKETMKFERSYKELIILMFIHSCLHLKGFQHGNDMSIQENKLLTYFLKQIKIRRG
jgi:rRNA maturation RNase YbeY